MTRSIRLATPADAPALLAIYEPYVRETAISFELEPPSEARLAGRIETVLQALPWLVAESGGAIIGYAYALPFRGRPAYAWTTELTVYVERGAHGRGHGRALYTALLRCVEALGYCNALGVITLPNPASVALHRVLGFEEVGVVRGAGFKHGTWHDIAFWQRVLDGRRDAPPPPRTIGELSASPEWPELLAE